MASESPSASPPRPSMLPPRASPPPPTPEPAMVPVLPSVPPSPSISPPPPAPRPSGSNSLPSPPPPSPSGGSSSPPLPPLEAVPPSKPPPPPPPPSVSPITRLFPPPPPTTSPERSPPPPPLPGQPPPSDRAVVSPPPPPPLLPPPPTSGKGPESSPLPPPPSAKSSKRSPPPPRPAKAPESSPAPPASKLSPPPPRWNRPKASSPPPPSGPPTGTPPPSASSSHSPSTSLPPPHSEQAGPPSPSTVSPLFPTRTSPPSADSPTPISRNSSETSSLVKENSSIGTGSIVGISIGIGVFILSFIGLAIWCAKCRRRKGSRFSSGHIISTSISTSLASDASSVKIPSSAPLMGSSSRSEILYFPNEPPGGFGNSRLWFTYDDLAKATDGFSADNFLGEGGFGSVYKGRLQDGREVAVKQLKVGAKQGEREFMAEVDIISRIHHRHLVSLVGYCIADDRKLLVYDYVPNNTLYFHLHGKGRPALDWATRVKIAAGAARGLVYLHEDCHPRVIHRDIKSSNILLDNNFEARVSDFGLAKLALDAHTHITTRVMGTFGYKFMCRLFFLDTGPDFTICDSIEYCILISGIWLLSMH
ncbi:hypothetical protein CDL15_Pgr009486 [Punica granatum]|uniref:non-specific serine/threonine protein kinase n=1 Tax=Punica granatum TaxID=22663 RepID=A0A218WV30_PUNGR|nr:hypothetical protein CDL15_Pgr009486 [Punica granatum]